MTNLSTTKPDSLKQQPFSHHDIFFKEFYSNPVDYLFKAVPGMSRELWEKTEKEVVAKGLLAKGGYMDVKERIREEGRQEGQQEGRQEVVRNMLQNKLETSLLSKVTGLSEKEIDKLKNGA